jgi:hypothetical protein
VPTGKRGGGHAHDRNRGARGGGLQGQHVEMVVSVNDEFGAVCVKYRVADAWPGSGGW